MLLLPRGLHKRAIFSTSHVEAWREVRGVSDNCNTEGADKVGGEIERDGIGAQSRQLCCACKLHALSHAMP